MINKFLKVVAILSILTTLSFAKQGVMFNVVDGDVEEHYMKMVNKKIKDIGFVLSDPHERINDAYERKYGDKKSAQYDPDWNKNLDNLGFFTISNDVKLHQLLIKEPMLGSFSPFNLHIYKKMSENKTYIGHIMPETMLDIIGIKDTAIRSEFSSIFPDLDKFVNKNMGGTVEYREYTSLPKKTMMKFELEFDRPEDLSDYIDEFQEEFEEKMEDKQYIIAGYKNFKQSYEELGLEFDKYDEYYVYSLCHFTFSYSIFNKGRPDAGAFAPCSMYMYIEKGTNKLIIGMPLLANWVAVLNIKDEKMNKLVDGLDKEITDILLSMGAKEIE